MGDMVKKVVYIFGVCILSVMIFHEFQKNAPEEAVENREIDEWLRESENVEVQELSEWLKGSEEFGVQELSDWLREGGVEDPFADKMPEEDSSC